MVSIVIPVYNAEKYIEHCIESVLAQTYGDWELILIDNGSTDDSLEICQKYAKEDERIFVFHQFRNQGVSVARNLGVEKCTGEFLTFIDADDWVKKDYLEQLLKLQKRYQTPMVVCGYENAYEIDRKRLKEAEKRYQTSHKVYNLENYFEKYLLEGNTHCWGVLYSYELAEKIKFPVGMSIGEDLLFLIEAAMESEKVVVTDYRGYYYYINEAGAMKKKFTKSYMDQITCWQKAEEKIIKQYPGLKDKLQSILMVSVMLVVGKISELEKSEQKNYREQLKLCHQLVQKYKKNKAVYQYLPSGYGIKVKLFAHLPQGYLRVYGALKR